VLTCPPNAFTVEPHDFGLTAHACAVRRLGN
jgi:hypothetical protein